MRATICEYCDKHPIGRFDDYPDMCDFCREEFLRFKTRIAATCETCKTPYSCQIHKTCNAPKQMELI